MPQPELDATPLTPPRRPWDAPAAFGPYRGSDICEYDGDDGRWNPEAHQHEPDSPQYSPTSAASSPIGMADVEDDPRLDTLMSLGVTEATARGRISAMRSTRAAATFAEVYGGGAIVDCANKARRDLNLKGLRSLDLRTLRSDGRPWDFSASRSQIGPRTPRPRRSRLAHREPAMHCLLPLKRCYDLSEDGPG